MRSMLLHGKLLIAQATYCSENSEGLRIENINRFVLCAQNEAADRIFIGQRLLHGGQASDNRLLFYWKMFVKTGKHVEFTASELQVFQGSDCQQTTVASEKTKKH